MSAKTPVMRDDYAPFFRSRSSGGAIVWSRSRARNWSPVVNPQHCRPGRQRVRTPKAIARVILAQVVEGHRRSEGIEGVKQRRKIGVRSSSDAAPIVGVRPAARRSAACRSSRSGAASAASEPSQHREAQKRRRWRIGRSRTSRRLNARQGCACWQGPSREHRIGEARGRIDPAFTPARALPPPVRPILAPVI